MSTAKFARCYELYRGQIQHEDLLLSQRVTWIVTSQAFLLVSHSHRAAGARGNSAL